MADTVVYDHSPAYTVLEFRQGSAESAGGPSLTAPDAHHGHSVVEALQEAGVIHRVRTDNLFDVAPATRCERTLRRGCNRARE